MDLHMKTFYFFIIAFFINSATVFSQETDNAAILKIIFTKYYKNEKVIAKERLQLLSFYCKKAPNNEEVLEVISKSDLLKKNAAEIPSSFAPPWMIKLILISAAR